MEISHDFSTFEYRIRLKQDELVRAKVINETKAKLQDEYDKLSELGDLVSDYTNHLALIKTRAIKENDAFRTKRLKYLGDSVTEAVEEVFPQRNLRAEISCDFKRKNAVSLKLLDESGNVFKPWNCNGKLMQYLISFSAVARIAESRGCHSLFIDEAFGVSSEENLPIIGEMIKDKVAKGMQIVLVSQNSALYSDVPHRAIKLEYRPKERKAVLVGISDVN